MSGVLFVCTANICRSPMAAVLFANWLKRRRIPGVWWVGSAGTRAADGTLATPEACDVMAARGLDLVTHRARRVHAGLVAAHEVVVGMTRSHCEALQVEYPDQAHRIHLFSEMIGRTYDVPDPYGLGREAYLRTADELADLVERGGVRIVELARRTH
jgi:protein-tyrosine phosphatase